MNAITPLAMPVATVSTVDLTALALEAQRIGSLTLNNLPAEAGSDIHFAYALEDTVLAGTPSKDSDCLAQLVLLVNRARMAADSPPEEMGECITAVADGMERAIVVLAQIMRLDILALGAGSYFYPGALRALGANTEEDVGR